ncbi:MAG: DUF1847 domain-containing protein [Chlorobiaceae bacterium]|nr:DUF1847 domain-containing protein [Chlorobiaceae bacterium]
MNTKQKRNKTSDPGCTDCGSLNCYRRDKEFPDFCPTDSVAEEETDNITAHYRGEGIDALIARVSAEIEGAFYGKLTRVEEIIAFARRLGVKKVGLATCIGLVEEARLFSKVLKAHDLEPVSVLCKIGSVDKTDIGIDDSFKIQKGCHEAMCNPILQAKYLQEKGTQLNVVIGLCVGHDSLFMKYSEAPVTTLVTKDRILGHNPAAALYTSRFYYKRLFEGNSEY